jgi:hypothetical protein
MARSTPSPPNTPSVATIAPAALAVFALLAVPIPAMSGALAVPQAAAKAELPPRLPACAEALRQGTVCAAANEEVARWLAARHLGGALVIQDVRTGALIAAAALPPPDAPAAAPPPAVAPEVPGGPGAGVDVNTPLLPLSISKVLLAASWWEHETTIRAALPAAHVDVHEMLVTGSDAAGKEIAVDLRHALGNRRVFADLARFGFPRCPEARPPADLAFWGALPPRWRRLVPAGSCTAIRPEWSDAQWAAALSIGESGFAVTLLHLSRFLQAIGNDGVMLRPVARDLADEPPALPSAGRPPALAVIVSAATARKVQAALIDNVRRGTATGIRGRLGGGWLAGGKTGSGPFARRLLDGCFAGLVFDDRQGARYTVVSYVLRGGVGGGAAALLAADVVAATLIPAGAPPHPPSSGDRPP